MTHDPSPLARTQGRATFDAAAALYDAVRPGYPEALIADAIALSGLPPGGRILEIGCGTGQATLPFARRGYRLLCLELGAQLAAAARRNLAAFPGVVVRIGAFEDWPVEAGAFDLAMAATAFHWLDPAAAYPKLARALRPGGALALFWNLHVQEEPDEGFFAAAQAVYRRAAPELVRDPFVPLRADQVPDRSGEIAASGCFTSVEARRYAWDAAYTAEGYVRLLQTYSDHRGLPPEQQERLYAGIARLIDERFGGRIRKGYLSVLYVARRT